MRINNIIIIYVILWIFSIILFFNKQNILKKFLFLSANQIKKIPFKGKNALAIPFLITVLHEMIFIITGINLFSEKEISEIFYDLSMFVTGEGKAADENYSEGYYEGLSETELNNITPREAEHRKFDKILELLGAKQGDKILDLGCGTGTFGEYCKTKGITVVGVTLSSEQVKHSQSKNLEAYRKDFSIYIPEFDNKFNHIVIIGSSEHIPTGSPLYLSSYKKKQEKMTEVLNYCHGYLKEGGQIFYSGIHINPKFYQTSSNLILARAYGSLVQMDDPNYDIVKSFTDSKFKDNRLFSRDSTRDYYLATVLDENHFGNAADFFSKGMLMLLGLSLIYPLCFYQYIYYTFGKWMWMWDGKNHFGSNKNYTLQEDKDKRPCTLYWHVYKK